MINYSTPIVLQPDYSGFIGLFIIASQVFGSGGNKNGSI